MKLGRRPPHPETTHPRLHLGHFLQAEALPQVPDGIDWLSRVADWPMYLNDQLGCCTVSAAGHMEEAWSAFGQGHTVEIGDQDVLAAYEAVGGYRPGDPSTDQGAVMQDVLNYWRTTGIGSHKILAFAQVDVANLAEVYAALYLFGAVYVGVNLPQSAMDQFDAGRPWTVVGDDGGILGGHAIHLGLRNGAALEVVTWGRVQGLDEGWWRRYAEEAWVVADQDWITASGGSPEGLDVAALNAAFTEITHGEPGPFVAPPAPNPTPSPTPPPPSPTPDPADVALAEAFRTGNWIGRHHHGDNHTVAMAGEAWLAAKPWL